MITHWKLKNQKTLRSYVLVPVPLDAEYSMKLPRGTPKSTPKAVTN